MNAIDLITLGDLVADLVVPIESLPLEAQKHQPANYIRLEPGGTSNTLIMAQRLGLQTKAIGSVGDDLFGRQVHVMLVDEGVDLSLTVKLPDATTTTALVIVDKQGQHVFVGQFGTGQPLEYDERWRSSLTHSGVLFLDGYSLREHGSLSHEAMIQCLQVAQAASVPIFFDLGPAYTSATREHIDAVLGYTTVFLATDEEICAWTDIVEPSDAASNILQRGVETIIVKAGMAGCRIVTQNETVDCPGFQVAVRDTAGAGDAFAAGAIYARLRGYSLEKMGEIANAVGGATVAKLGTGTALPSRKDVEQLLAQREGRLT